MCAAEAFFPAEDATTLQIRFDSQPTNRAGMNGLSPCEQVLANGTVQTLRGTATEPPLCDWQDDSTLVAYLTMFTDASPGMKVAVLGGVLWPRSWTGSCSDAASMCAEEGMAARARAKRAGRRVGSVGWDPTERNFIICWVMTHLIL